jgi:hypothetical protein
MRGVALKTSIAPVACSPSVYVCDTVSEERLSVIYRLTTKDWLTRPVLARGDSPEVTEVGEGGQKLRYDPWSFVMDLLCGTVDVRGCYRVQ